MEERNPVAGAPPATEEKKDSPLPQTQNPQSKQGSPPVATAANKEKVAAEADKDFLIKQLKKKRIEELFDKKNVRTMIKDIATLKKKGYDKKEEEKSKAAEKLRKATELKKLEEEKKDEEERRSELEKLEKIKERAQKKNQPLPEIKIEKLAVNPPLETNPQGFPEKFKTEEKLGAAESPAAEEEKIKIIKAPYIPKKAEPKPKAGLENQPPQKTQKNNRDDFLREKLPLEEKRRNLIRMLKSLDDQKKPFEKRRQELKTQADAVEKEFKLLENREKGIEEQEESIEEKEVLASSYEEKRRIEKQRWQIEERRRAQEQKRWPYDEKLKKIENEIAIIDYKIKDIEAKEETAKEKEKNFLEKIREINAKIEKIAVAERIEEIGKLKDFLESKKTRIQADIEGIEKKLEPLLNQEAKIESDKKMQEEEEKTTRDLGEKRKTEEKRWQIEEKRRLIEKQRWQIEEEKEKMESRLSDLEKRLSELSIKEERMNQRIIEIENPESSRQKPELAPLSEKEQDSRQKKDISDIDLKF